MKPYIKSMQTFRLLHLLIIQYKYFINLLLKLLQTAKT